MAYSQCLWSVRVEEVQYNEGLWRQMRVCGVTECGVRSGCGDGYGLEEWSEWSIERKEHCAHVL